MNDGEQRDRAVLITGGGHGIGQGIAAAFAAAGARVVVADRDLQRAADVAAGIRDKFGAAAVPLAVDVRDAAAVEAMANEAAAAIGPIDVLVNNAGIYPNTPVVEMDEAEWDAVFDTNVKGVFLVSRAIARQMIARGEGGKIVNISSGAAKSGRIGAAHYCSSKAAVDMFTRVLAIELAPHDIAVNAVGPGLIEVPNAPLTREYVETLIAQTPMRRIGTPADIAQAVLYLASSGATFITGTTLYVDGGSGAGRSVPLSG